MRATITEFGPVLLTKVLELNEVQSGVLMILFKYADDKKLPIVDLNDLKKVLNYLSTGDGAAEIKEAYGKISSATASTILRKIVANRPGTFGRHVLLQILYNPKVELAGWRGFDWRRRQKRRDINIVFGDVRVIGKGRCGKCC